MYKPILITLVGLILSVAADVPSLINYQGRLVDGVGNPVTGSKAFKLDIYDSQTDGTLIYQETLPDITLDEDGAYSFQFGAGISRTGTSQLIATGDGETMLFQTRLEQTPFGPITVTDGTNTFTQGDVATGEEPFTFLYVRGLNRINLVFNEPPAAGVKFTATYRYNEAGIVGALGTAAEHWMEVTIGGEKQEPRQRLVAVPFALKAGSLVNKRETKTLKFITFLNQTPDRGGASYTFIESSAVKKIFEIPFSAALLNKVKVPFKGSLRVRVLEYDYSKPQPERVVEVASFEYPAILDDDESVRIITPDLRLEHKDTNAYFLELSHFDSLNWAMDAPLIVEYEE